MVSFAAKCWPPKRGMKPMMGRRESKVAAFGCGGVWVFCVSVQERLIEERRGHEAEWNSSLQKGGKNNLKHKLCCQWSSYCIQERGLWGRKEHLWAKAPVQRGDDFGRNRKQAVSQSWLSSRFEERVRFHPEKKGLRIKTGKKITAAGHGTASKKHFPRLGLPGEEGSEELLQKDKPGTVAPCSLQCKKMVRQEA